MPTRGGGAIAANYLDRNIRAFYRVERQSTVTIDMECYAVHVALSSWGSYLDVDEYAQAYRAVKL